MKYNCIIITIHLLAHNFSINIINYKHFLFQIFIYEGIRNPPYSLFIKIKSEHTSK